MADTDAPARGLHCVLVTPERMLLDEAADFVALPMYDGELGVLPGRAPLIGRLGPGELRIRRGGTVRRFYVDGGFAQVRDNAVTVLTARAQKAEEIDPAAAERALEEAQQPAPNPEAQEARRKAQLRARAQLRVARHLREAGAAHG
jgi:F-type H+-transporting ATPase subunit epsilon